MSGMSGGDGGGSTSTGFHQSPAPFSGLTNTDLRPRRRHRRPVPLLDTSWPRVRSTGRGDPLNRRKGHVMRKDVADLVGTLRASVLEIADSAAPNRDELLAKSFEQFGEALAPVVEPLEGVSDLDPPELEPLGEGLEHINAFGTALGEMRLSVDAIFAGNPLRKRDITEAEAAGIVYAAADDLSERIETFMQLGELILAKMVNDSVEIIDTDLEAAAAEADGTLAKIDTAAGTLLVRTPLPDELCAYLADPLDLLVKTADLARALTGSATLLAGELAKAEALPDDLLDAYPELVFDVGELLEKAFPPKKGASPESVASRTATSQGSADDGSSDREEEEEDEGDEGGDGQGGEDEAVGGGGANPDAGEGPTDITDDAPQNPIEMITRLASIIVVIGGSLLQGQQGADQSTDQAVNGPDAGNVGLQRGETIGDLRKIYAGEIEIDPALADELEELQERRAAGDRLQKQLEGTNAELEKMKQAMARLQSQPAPGKGRLMAPVGKSEDVGGELAKGEAATAEAVDSLRKTAPEQAAKLLIAQAHRAGGHSLLPGG